MKGIEADPRLLRSAHRGGEIRGTKTPEMSKILKAALAVVGEKSFWLLLATVS